MSIATQTTAMTITSSISDTNYEASHTNAMKMIVTMILACDRWTDRRTHDDSIYCASTASCGKKLTGSQFSLPHETTTTFKRKY